MPYPSPNPALNFCRTLPSILVLSLVVLASGFATGVQAQTEKYIAPVPLSQSGFIFDSSGNLYATSERGGNLNCGNGVGCGTVFELSQASGGGWTTTVLYHFQGGSDGESPYSTLVFDNAGNLYGTTAIGGGSANCNLGCGTVFKLSPTASGWTEKVIHSFDGTDGSAPFSGLILDDQGNLYGTTSGTTTSTGCSNGASCGTVFEISLASGSPQFTVLHAFAGGSEGSIPLGPLTLDAAGDLYGVTAEGGNTGTHCGPLGCGVAFKLTPASGTWPETILHTFMGADGFSLNGGLTFDGRRQNLYGTAYGGGTYDWGEVFKLSVASGKLTVAYSFTGNGEVDAGDPSSGVIFDKAGNLYGTTTGGFNNGCDIEAYCGSVFKLSPSTSGWQFNAQYLIPKAWHPASGGIVLDHLGNIFGIADEEHYRFVGEVYEVIP